MELDITVLYGDSGKDKRPLIEMLGVECSQRMASYIFCRNQSNNNFCPVLFVIIPLGIANEVNNSSALQFDLTKTRLTFYLLDDSNLNNMSHGFSKLCF